MRSITVFIVCVLAISVSAEAWADVPPYCYYPDKYPVSMTVSPAQVDVSKYMGQWFEVARFPAPNQKDCDCAEANYTFDPQGFVKVLNKCAKQDGTSSVAEGKAIPKNSANTKLEVFFGGPVAGNYWVLDIEPNYQWVVIGEPCKNMGWILSRTRQLAPEVLAARVQTLAQKGYDVSKLIYRGSTC